jgi:hypothetical protein
MLNGIVITQKALMRVLMARSRLVSDRGLCLLKTRET